MRVYWKCMNGGCKPKSDEQVVSEGAKNTTYQDSRLFLAGRTHAQGNHLCSCPKRNDGCSDNSLTQTNESRQGESTLNNGWAAHGHCSQAAEGEHDRFPAQTRTSRWLVVIIVCGRVTDTRNRCPVCPKQEECVAHKH